MTPATVSEISTLYLFEVQSVEIAGNRELTEACGIGQVNNAQERVQCLLPDQRVQLTDRFYFLRVVGHNDMVRKVGKTLLVAR